MYPLGFRTKKQFMLTLAVSASVLGGGLAWAPWGEDAVSSDAWPEVDVRIQPHAVRSIYESMYSKGLFPKHGEEELRAVSSGELSEMSVVMDESQDRLGLIINGSLVFGPYYAAGSAIDAHELAGTLLSFSEAELARITNSPKGLGGQEELGKYGRSVPDEDEATSLGDPGQAESVERKQAQVDPAGEDSLNQNAASASRDDAPTLSREQKERLQAVMSNYFNKKKGTMDGADAKESQSSENGDVPPQDEGDGTITSARVNVSKIQESKTAIYYLGQLLPKAGYNKDGEVLPRERKKAQVKLLMERIKQAGDKWSIHYPAQGDAKKTIAIFGDPTCPVCQALHQEIPKLQAAGVDVYYMFYNRNLAPHTVGSAASRKSDGIMTNVWCSADNAAALDEAMEGYAIRPQSCDTLEEMGRTAYPGNEHYLLGRIIDMKGTPYTITDDGEIIGGYNSRARQPDDFLSRIGIQ